jgi:hypothetical protein
VNLSVPSPRPIEVLFHSPVVCGTTKQHEFSDAAYYTTPSGAGVFSSGTQGWVCALAPPAPTAAATRGSRRRGPPSPPGCCSSSPPDPPDPPAPPTRPPTHNQLNNLHN